MNNNISLFLNKNYGKEYLKTIFACSCSSKEQNQCIDCKSNISCKFGNDNIGFVFCDYYVYDFDGISIRINKCTSFQSVDSIIIHDDRCISFVEFTNGNPYNKNTFKKCIDSLNTIKKINNDIDSKKIIDYYFVYNSKKLDYNTFEKYKQIMYDDFFLPFIDINGNQDIKIEYFKLSKICEMFRRVFAFNEDEFIKAIENNNSWEVYNDLVN